MIELKTKRKLVAINEIKILPSFAKSKPRRWKMKECREFYAKHGVQDRYIVLNKNGYCIDGYVMYLILKEQGEQIAEVIYSEKNNKLNRKTKWQIFKSKIRKVMMDANKE